jgi:hypothetical protein
MHELDLIGLTSQSCSIPKRSVLLAVVQLSDTLSIHIVLI